MWRSKVTWHTHPTAGRILRGFAHDGSARVGQSTHRFGLFGGQVDELLSLACTPCLLTPQAAQVQAAAVLTSSTRKLGECM